MVDAEGPRPCQLRRAWNMDNFHDKVADVEPREKKELPTSPNSFYVAPKPENAPGLCQKQFLIFDRSGDETRMMVSPFLSRVQNRISLAKRSFDVYNAHDENAEVEKKYLTNLIDREKVDENNIFREDTESEMHEDTEEINALLYSDDSDAADDDEDDEVTSTDHSPLKVSEFADLVPSSDGSKKRQRFLDGGYKNSSLKLIKSPDDNDDVESSCGIRKNPKEDTDSGLSLGEKKVKMRQTLKVLEEIVPGLTTKDPLFIIDGAIDYLKSLRRKAETLGVCLTTSQSQK